jgi:hypothetical protein
LFLFIENKYFFINNHNCALFQHLLFGNSNRGSFFSNRGLNSWSRCSNKKRSASVDWGTSVNWGASVDGSGGVSADWSVDWSWGISGSGGVCGSWSISGSRGSIGDGGTLVLNISNISGVGIKNVVGDNLGAAIGESNTVSSVGGISKRYQTFIILVKEKHFQNK